MRSSGVLLHISSLPSPHGIGTLGREAYKFVDYLVSAGQSFWQVLPVLTTGYADSPYQSFSTYAGNPYFVDLDFLVDDGYLTRQEIEEIDFGDNPESVDYYRLFLNRGHLLRKAYERAIRREKRRFADFARKNAWWLRDFALFASLKERFGFVPYTNWPQEIRDHEEEAIRTYTEKLHGEIEYHEFVQYLFFQQWRSLKRYANDRGIRIIGDIPIYVAADSCDTWSNRHLFLLDDQCLPVRVAGCPPDAFTCDGQRWGNPLYRWEIHRETEYEWWHARLGWALSMYDVVRIDHFRGFSSFYSVPYEDATAKNGTWTDGPGTDLFRGIRSRTRGFRIIAEDLGFMDDKVRKLLADTGFPGMKVMMFGFDATGSGDDVPYQHAGHCVSYIGTHDNETFMGFMKSAVSDTTRRARRYMNLTESEGFNWGAIRTLLGTGSELTIITMQDILGLDNQARMNTPSTPSGNWLWRLPPDWPAEKTARKLRILTETFGRLPE